ncbi:hypothetical protein GGS24DRAFT_515436 [Hypoxylon argillaceum]|nr:hypothetical protein GGS24DRAFT_515436 [Hypoxylon argillaceum]
MQGTKQGKDDGIFRDKVDNERHNNHTQASKFSGSSSTSSASSRSSFHRFHVATTDPEHTTQLWKAVMSYRGDAESSRGKRRETPCASSSKPTTSSPLTPRRRQPSTSITASLAAESGEIITAKVTDADFMESVLEPYGITIQTGGGNKDLRKHFGILSLPTDLKDRLDVYKKAFRVPLNVWLEADMKRSRRIQQEYKSLTVYGCNEAEYSTYALRDVFLDEPRRPWLPIEQGDQRWVPIRLLRLLQKPNKIQPENWDAPPELCEPRKRYEWDICPDCAYHVSLLAFQTRVRSNIEDYVSVVQRRAFCPYFTIEFKKDEDNITTARYQMRHYGLTCTGVRWNLWCTVPKSFDSWTGCNMLRLYSGDCDVFEGVQQLIGIINDIHYWGLEVHGKSCKADIVAIAQSDPDTDTNDITLLEE